MQGRPPLPIAHVPRWHRPGPGGCVGAVVPAGRFKCACVDCPGACPTGSCTPLPDSFATVDLAGSDLPVFSVVIMAFLLTAAVATAALTFFLKRGWRKPAQGSDAERLAPTHLPYEKPEDAGDARGPAPGGEGAVPLGVRARHQVSVFFGWLGGLCARKRWLVIYATGVALALGAAGVPGLEVETRPINLWVSSSSQAREEMATYDQAFGPFYRSEQVVAFPEGGGNATTADTVNAVWALEDRVYAISVPDPLGQQDNVTLDDICYKALEGKGVQGCTVQSVTQWFRARGGAGPKHPQTRTEVASRIRECAVSPNSPNCLGIWHGPSLPQVALGGYPEAPKPRYLEATVRGRPWGLEGDSTPAPAGGLSPSPSRLPPPHACRP